MLARFALASLLITGTAMAVPIVYTTQMSGALESPPVSSAGTGFAIVTIDTDAHTLRVQFSFSGLTGNTTAAHLHCCTAAGFTGNVGVATVTPTFPFTLGVASGSFDQTFNTTLAASFNSAFVTANGGTAAGAETRLASGLASGLVYLNIHSNSSPGGEIRGFLATPEPSTIGLTAGALALAAFFRRKKHKS